MNSEKVRLMGLGAASGCAWLFLALLFDKGVRDFNYPVIPTDTVVMGIASGMAAVLTGILIAWVFGGVISSGSRAAFYSLPLVTLPLAITMFSMLVWLVWLLFGDLAVVSDYYRLDTILSFLLGYGLISVFTPILYVCAVGTQCVIRSALRDA